MTKLILLTALAMFICGSVGSAETLPYGYLDSLPTRPVTI